MIGEKTFGTGTILTPFPLEDGSIAVIGTNFWLTPNGELAWHKGIEPDLEISLAPESEIQSPSDDPRLSKAELEKTTDDQLKKAHQEVLAAVRAQS
jgi:carboxyl-terminal processing protease